MSESQTRAAPRADNSHTFTNATQNGIHPAPTTAHTTAQSTAQSATPTANTATPLPGTHPTTIREPMTFNDELNAADRYWKFKGVFYAILVITGLVGIGCIGWLLNSSPAWNSTFGYAYDYSWELWPSLITFTVSVIWCLVCVIILVVRKKPVHPGVRVAMDLLLWLGFVISVTFATFAAINILTWGDYGISVYGFSSSSGRYELAANGTWVWDQGNSDYITTSRSCNSTSSFESEYGYYFKDCVEQDAFINKIWQAKPARTRAEMTGVVCQYFGLVLHIVLFIWACVDTHRYNRTKVSSDAEKLAASIVQTMIHNGAIVPPPGQSYVRQGMYYQLPPQQAYPMANIHPQAQQASLQQPYPAGHSAALGVAPSSEKSSGPRFA